MRNNKLSSFAIIIIGIISIYTIFNTKYWKDQNRVVNWDVVSYYAYLPATFVHKDLALSFTYNTDKYFGERKFWPETTPEGKKVIKTSMGMSVLYSPFFLLAHSYCIIKNNSADGFSTPYFFMLKIATIAYLLLGLFYLRKILLQYFPDYITALTMLILVLTTHLFHYSILEIPMPHTYNFALFAIFLYHTIQWHKNITIKRTLIIGLLSGLITLIRPTNIIILVIFILWDIKNIKDLKDRFLMFVNNYKQILWISATFLLVWLPQLIYWKQITGNWFFYSYMDERFFFNSPYIIEGLFSYRKGWLLYTPIMSFALIGIFLMRKKINEAFLPILIFKIFNIYIILSWWCWWYGGGFGSRPFIDSYSILAIPLAYIIHKSIASLNKIIKYSSISILCLFIVHGIFQNLQHHYGAIHYDSMNKEAYFDSFGRIKPSEKFYTLIKSPDYDKAKKGIEEYP